MLFSPSLRSCVILSVFQFALLLLPVTLGDEPLDFPIGDFLASELVSGPEANAALARLVDGILRMVRGYLFGGVGVVVMIFILLELIGRCPFSYARKSYARVFKSSYE